MDHALAISCSKSNEASGSQASRGVLISCSKTKRKNKLKVVVVDDNEEEIQQMVTTLMKKDNDGDSGSVVGFEVEYCRTCEENQLVIDQKTSMSHLIFTNGSIAYVLFLGFDPRLPKDVLRFLLHPKLTFVSMGMQRHIDFLGVLYEASCRNAVDLGQLASERKGNPRLRNCGIDLLAKGIGMSETPKPSSLKCTRPDRMVDNEYISEAVINTYAYQLIGKTLLFGKN